MDVCCPQNPPFHFVESGIQSLVISLAILQLATYLSTNINSFDLREHIQRALELRVPLYDLVNVSRISSGATFARRGALTTSDGRPKTMIQKQRVTENRACHGSVSDRGEGLSQPKGKGMDPRNWEQVELGSDADL
ncbi:hypothetical protein FA15DRAFT_709595 [Coprinopsis marcescibilis]|uniref:Uncharacterized protein n=1 Tax=Coprinopsis marcescibilis TaxID=230819 RepID=A0A5C3KFX5_COPMA|nr:hypothetical protein FA15DRAFT_709595 [Coprinopsis marcescibilis]